MLEILLAVTLVVWAVCMGIYVEMNVEEDKGEGKKSLLSLFF